MSMEFDEIYRAIAEESATGIVVQQDGLLIYANPALYRLFGYDPAERTRWYGTSILTAIHPEDHGRILEAAERRRWTGGYRWRHDVRVIRNDGSPLWVEAVFARCRLGGRPASIGTVIDISERRRVEEATRRSAEDMRAINAFAVELAAAPPEADLLALIGERLQGLTGALVAVVSTFDPGLSEFTIRHLSADARLPPLHWKALALDPVGTRIPVDSGTLEQIRRDSVMRTASLRDIAGGILSEAQERAVRELSAYRSVNVVSLGLGGDLYGAVVLLLPEEASPSSHEAMRSFSHLAALSLRRRKVEQERDRLEEQLRQAHKLESIGRLAGGVAHDFNNLITVIGGNAHLALEEVRAGSDVAGFLEEIRRTAASAGDLTRQLLSFSRKQPVQRQAVRIGALVAGMRSMLRRLLGENVRLEVEAGADAGEAWADPGQIEQIVVNLAVNARDAMPGGGSLRIETRSVVDAAPEPGAPPRPLAEILVRDTGTGMSAEVKEHLFEPFFTTKPKGQGTGLGLATVYGIVKQNDGTIEVESAPGRGTTVRIRLPYCPGKGDARPRNREERPLRRGAETILLVEDEEPVRRIAERQLTAQGYRVLSHGVGAEALAAAAAYRDRIHVLLTDVVMPGMSGRELARRLRAERPDVRVILSSGYSEELLEGGDGVTGEASLLKPFTPADLDTALRAVLDTPSDPRPSEPGNAAS